MDFPGACNFLLDRLNRELSPKLFYHNVMHTVDVIEAAERIGISEKIDDAGIVILKTAALYHDSGMMTRYKEHETASVTLAEQTLPGFGFSTSEIDHICNLIMVTKLPQRPANLFEEVLCDADLDYLGKEDFFVRSFNLKREWEENNIMTLTLTEWYRSQIRFLSDHQYFTKSAFQLRDEKKQHYLKQIIQLFTPENNFGSN